jgi:glycerate 2-kinase
MNQPAARNDLETIFRAAIDAVEPRRLVVLALGGWLAGSEGVPAMVAEAQRILVLAVGKAALGMAQAIEAACASKISAGIAVVPTGIPPASVGAGFRIFHAGHPLPNAASEDAARAGIALVGGAGPDDLVIVALSGGASALFAVPGGAITIADKIAVTETLLRAGASIDELNAVRKHLSAVKGGRLLRAIGGARVLGLILSDVSGNDPAIIGSGLTAADATTYADARQVLIRYGLWEKVPRSVRQHLERGGAGQGAESVKPGDPALGRVTNLVIGDNAAALQGASDAAVALGYPVDLRSELKGEARDIGRAIARYLCGVPQRKLCVLAGGEPVVTVRGDGRGGRAQELALSIAIELGRIGGQRQVAVLAAGTDGIDGPTDAAGAFAYTDTVRRALAAGVDPEAALARNDSYKVFDAIGDLFRPGSTGTNVADILIAVVNY